MSITSNLFFLFTAFWLLIYYLLPKRFQWVVLLIASYSFYVLASPKAAVFLVFSTLVTFYCAKAFDRIRERISDKKEASKAMRRIIVLGIVLDVGVLAVLKYTDFVVGNINAAAGTDIQLFHFILPLGISYYTLQSAGYLLDVYWGKHAAEQNVFKYALFVSFFPQLTQGPIGRYSHLMPQLTAERGFELKNIKYGIERIVWGLFKKMVIAEWVSVFRTAIFADPDQYAGITIFGVVIYSIELYADFSGGIDVVIGVAELFGIHMQENFKRPFFAVSIADFWRKWHISLGSWMKDYVFYPLSLSHGMKKLKKKAKKVFGRRTGSAIVIAIADIIVFALVGLWHGPTWNYIGWGLYNGIIIGFSVIMEERYTRAKKALHINDRSKGWYVFMILRTFALFNIGQYFDCVNSFGEAFHVIGLSVTHFDPSLFLTISSGKLGTAFTPYAILIIVISCVLWFIISVLQERGMCVRDKLSGIPIGVQLAIFLLIFVCIGLFSPMSASRGFIYAQF